MVRNRRNGSGGLGTGLLLIVVGLAFFLDKIHVVEIHDAWRGWPILLIVMGLARLIAPGDRRKSRGWGLSFALLGALFLAIEYGWKGLAWQNAWPVIIMIVGAGFIADSVFDRLGRDRESEEEKTNA